MMAVKCQSCKGTGFIEYEHGLIRLRCEACKGKGEVEIDDGDGAERTGQRVEIAGGEAPRKYRKSRKSKVGCSTTKRHG